MGVGDDQDVFGGDDGDPGADDQLVAQLPSAEPASAPASAPAKRGPGRPAGSKSKSKPKPGARKPASSATRSQNDPLVREPVRLRVDNAARSKAARPETPKASAELDAGDTTQASALVLMMANTAACMAFGPEASVNEQELGMIQPSLARMLSRMSPAAVELFGALADPIMLAGGLAFWGLRVSGIVAQKRAILRAQAAQQAAEAAASVQSTVQVTPEPVRGAEGPSAPSTNGHADYAKTGAAPIDGDLAAWMGGIDGFQG